jgi:hypothetical protein
MENIIIDEEYVLKVVVLYYIYHYKPEEIQNIYNISLYIVDEIIKENMNNNELLDKLRTNKTFVRY